jgi:hypothetical protein
MAFELAPEKQDQLENMIKTGSKNKQIKEYFQNTYQIDIPNWKLGNTRNALKKSAGIKSPRKYAKRGERPAGQKHKMELFVPPADDLMEAVNRLEKELGAFCKTVRRRAQREIIKYVARIRKARITMGEVITKKEKENLEAQLVELDIDPAEIKEVNL